MHLASASLMLPLAFALQEGGSCLCLISWFHPQEQTLKTWWMEAHPTATLFSQVLNPIGPIFLFRKVKWSSNCPPLEEKPHTNYIYVLECLEAFIPCTHHFLQLLHPLKSLFHSYLGSFASSLLYTELYGEHWPLLFNFPKHTPMRQWCVADSH